MLQRSIVELKYQQLSDRRHQIFSRDTETDRGPKTAEPQLGVDEPKSQ